MGEKRRALASFMRRFRRSPVRWGVLVHAVILAALVALLTVDPGQEVLWLLDSSLVTAQVALLLIWMVLDGSRRSNVNRTLGVTGALLVVYVVHTPAVDDPQWIPSVICVGPGIFLMLGLAALPLTIAGSRGFLIGRFRRERMPPSRRLQFSIRSVVVAAVCVAILFSLKGLAVAVSGSPESIALGILAPFALVGMALVVIAVYLSIPLVAVWAVLSPGDILPRLAAAVTGWAMGVLLMFHYTQSGDGSFHVSISAGVTAGAIAIVLCTLCVLRQMGYRAVRVDTEGWMILDESDPASSFDSPDPFVENDD